MATISDVNLANSVSQAIASGSSESTVESQHTRAIAILTAKVPQNTGETTIFAAAIALLNVSLSHLRDPRNH